MGSADSKLNFRKAVIQLTTKTQVRPGPRPSHAPARVGAGQGFRGWGNGCKNLASRGLGGPAGQEGDAAAREERDSWACTPGLHPLVPHPQPSLPGTSLFPAAAAATLDLRLTSPLSAPLSAPSLPPPAPQSPASPHPHPPKHLLFSSLPLGGCRRSGRHRPG